LLTFCCSAFSERRALFVRVQAHFGTKSNFKYDFLMPHGPFFYAYGVSMRQTHRLPHTKRGRRRG
jgi:hypothetical protein